MSKTYKVSGMTCGGCARSVEQAIAAAAPGAKVRVDLAAGTVTVEAAAEPAVARAVADAGFEFGGSVQ